MTTPQYPTPHKQYARAALTPESFDPDTRTVELVWTTGAPVRRNLSDGEPFDEHLSTETEHVRLDRLNQGAPVLNSHHNGTLQDVIGVVERAWLADGQGMARIRLSNRDDVQPIAQDIRDGIVRHISVGYTVHQFNDVSEDDNPIRQLRAVDWEPQELSLVPIAADAGASLRTHPESHNTGEHSMADLNSETGTQSNDAAAVEPPSQLTVHVDDPIEAIQAERERAQAIIETVRAAHLESALAEQWIREGVSIDRVREHVIDAWSAQQQPMANTHTVRVEPGDYDARDIRMEGITQALLHRYDPKQYTLDERAKPYLGASLLELARTCETARGTAMSGLPKLELAERAMLTTSDFPIILANVANKTLRDAYQAAPQTFRPFVRETTASDFKIMTRVQLGDVPNLEKVNEHGEFTYGNMGESQEEYQVATYGKVIALTRQTIINDDLDAFTRLPQRFGRAAANLESDLVYGVFLANHTMHDTQPLFSKEHHNVSEKGATLGIDSMSAARKSMRLQRGVREQNRLNLFPRYLLVPAQLETAAHQFMSQQYQPDTQQHINPFAGQFTIITEPRLDAGGENTWYLLADPSQIDMIEIAYLDGQRGVHIETRHGFEVDGIEIKARLDVGVKAIDWRGLYRATGA